MTTLFNHIDFHTIYQFALTYGDELHTRHNLRCDDLYLLVKTLPQGHSHTFSTAVLIEEHITVIGSDEFFYRLVRRYNHIRFT